VRKHSVLRSCTTSSWILSSLKAASNPLNVELHTAMAIDIPAFEATPVADIAGKVSKLRATFNTQKTKDVQFRLVQLRKLYWGY
jgi:hypothetical protein